MIRTTRRALGSLILLSLGACATPTATNVPPPGAPQLTGFGTISLPLASPLPAAQRWYTQGVLQAYAFNEVEAVRMFKAALAEDPRCAMCAWGVAWQLGPNINDIGRMRVPEALPYLDIALENAVAATPRDRALIDALALRYAHASQTAATAPLVAERCGAPAEEDRPDPLDQAYADRLHDLVRAAPDDPELLALWAEAEMVATRDDWWPADGPPAGRIGELTTALERGLALRPEHIGLNHYLIHAVDAPGQASRARAAADRLGQLAPGSPHLLHMPSHTYVRLGRYGEAAQVNQAAVAPTSCSPNSRRRRATPSARTGATTTSSSSGTPR